MRTGRRPRVDGQPSERRREFRLTPEEDAELQRIARENRLPVATLIREAVNEYVADYSDAGRTLRS